MEGSHLFYQKKLVSVLLHPWPCPSSFYNQGCGGLVGQGMTGSRWYRVLQVLEVVSRATDACLHKNVTDTRLKGAFSRLRGAFPCCRLLYPGLVALIARSTSQLNILSTRANWNGLLI